MGKKILIIDDDKMVLQIIESRLKKEGYETLAMEDSRQVLEKIETFEPDLLVTDLQMPGIDGFEIMKQVRDRKELRNTKIIVVSAKSFEFDKNRAHEMGAQAFLVKPIDFEELFGIIDKVIKEEVKLTFWGTRGTLTTPGQGTLKFGGNTSCVSLELNRDRVVIFDAGTGITELGRYLASTKKRYKIHLFITHPHWDHINGFPFFAPAYMQGNEVVVYGSSHGSLSLRRVISDQMDSIYFPITMKEFASRVYFNEITEGEYEVEGLVVKTLLLNHPGITLGYKAINSNGKSVAYITDNELVPENIQKRDNHGRQKLVSFLDQVDVLIHDSTYFDDEYPTKVGWGHSPISEVCKLAAEAKVKSLCLSHHSPDHNDEQIEEKEAFGKRYFEERNLDIECYCAVEGTSIKL